jgi:hypothetical protein
LYLSLKRQPESKNLQLLLSCSFEAAYLRDEIFVPSDGSGGGGAE